MQPNKYIKKKKKEEGEQKERGKGWPKMVPSVHSILFSGSGELEKVRGREKEDAWKLTTFQDSVAGSGTPSRA